MLFQGPPCQLFDDPVFACNHDGKQRWLGGIEIKFIRMKHEINGLPAIFERDTRARRNSFGKAACSGGESREKIGLPCLRNRSKNVGKGITFAHDEGAIIHE